MPSCEPPGTSGRRQAGAASGVQATGSVAVADGDPWLDRFARTLGSGWLAGRVPGTLPPSYPYAIVSIVLFTTGTFIYSVSIVTCGGIESAHGMPDRRGGSVEPNR